MIDGVQRILERLYAVGFEVREGGLAPFGEELPLVTAVAWEHGTAQVALIAEAEGPPDDEAWRQLLFAASGLRHHLAGDSTPAFGTPLVLAVVDQEGERGLRQLVEDLTSHYAIFNRVDLNLVRERDFETADALDVALAPLLPTCRTMLGTVISQDDVKRFWEVLRDEIGNAAFELDETLGDQVRGSD